MNHFKYILLLYEVKQTQSNWFQPVSFSPVESLRNQPRDRTKVLLANFRLSVTCRLLLLLLRLHPLKPRLERFRVAGWIAGNLRSCASLDARQPSGARPKTKTSACVRACERFRATSAQVGRYSRCILGEIKENTRRRGDRAWPRANYLARNVVRRPLPFTAQITSQHSIFHSCEIEFYFDSIRKTITIRFQRIDRRRELWIFGGEESYDIYVWAKFGEGRLDWETNGEDRMINLYHLARPSICYTDEFVVYALFRVDDLFFFFFFF